MIVKNVSIAQATSHLSHPAQMLYTGMTPDDVRKEPFGFLAMCEDGTIRGGITASLMSLSDMIANMKREYHPTEIMSFDFREADPRVLFPARRSA